MKVAITSPGSMLLQFRSAAMEALDLLQQSEEVAAAVLIEDVDKSVEPVTRVEVANPVEGASVDAQSAETPLQGSGGSRDGGLSNGSVAVECADLACRTNDEEHKSVFVANYASDGGSEGNTVQVHSGVHSDTTAPPFNPSNGVTFSMNQVLLLPVPTRTCVAVVTPFKDHGRRFPSVTGARLRPQISCPPVQALATSVAVVTPIRTMTTVHPPLAPLPPPLYPFQYEPYMGVVMHGILPPRFQSHPQAPLCDGGIHQCFLPINVLPGAVMMGTKKLNPDAEEFIPSSRSNSNEILYFQHSNSDSYILKGNN